MSPLRAPTNPGRGHSATILTVIGMSAATGFHQPMPAVDWQAEKAASTGWSMKGRLLMMRQPVTAPVSVTMHLATTVPDTLASRASRGMEGDGHERRVARVSTSPACIGPATGAGGGSGAGGGGVT